MLLTITDTKNKDFIEVKEMTPSQLVDMVGDNVENGSFGITKWLKIGFQDNDSWDKCVKFIDETAKEMAVRNVMIYGNQSLDFQKSDNSQEYANITRRNLSIKGEDKITSFAVQRYRDNDDLILYGFQAETGRPILPNSVDIDTFYRAKFDPAV